MQITDVRLRKVNSENRMKAVASVTFDNEFAVHDIKVIESQNGLFIAMPSRKTPNGEFKDIAHPINAETRKLFEDAIKDAELVLIGIGEEFVGINGFHCQVGMGIDFKRFTFGAGYNALVKRGTADTGYVKIGYRFGK